MTARTKTDLKKSVCKVSRGHAAQNKVKDEQSTEGAAMPADLILLPPLLPNNQTEAPLLILQDEPNLTVILPGPCQARCAFCVEPEGPSPDSLDGWLKAFRAVLEELPPVFRVLSISGGEPTLSKVFRPMLELLAERRSASPDALRRVVLTTNGAALTKNMDLVLRAVTHLNLSRHAVDESANAEVFRSVKVPRLQDLRAQIGKFNAHGIPVNLNCVYTRSQALGLNLDVTSKSQLRAAAKSYISMAKELRASSIVFRSDHRGGLTDEGTLLEHCFDDFAVVHSASCASCRVVTKLIRGLPVNFKQSAYEPSALHPSDELYELIFHSDGLLYRDWSRKIPVRRPLRLSLEPWAEALFYGRHANLVLVPEECHSRPSCHVLATSHPGPF